jgi:zinc transport system permease protein
MGEFLTALGRFQFLQLALVSGLLASVACGIVGTFVVVRRISYIAASISHCTLAGLGAAHYLEVVHGWSWLHPLHGALVAAVVSALWIGMVSLRAKEREDTVIGATWAIGMAIGVLFVSQTPGYNQDLMSYLFGNILMASSGELELVAVLDLFVVGVCVFLYKPLVAICFDEEFARIRGIRVESYFLLLLVLTAITVVMMTTLVGIVLVIALLTLPAAIAGFFSTAVWRMMLGAIFLCALFSVGGLYVSYTWDLPAGASIVILAGGAYLALVAALRGTR